MNPDRLLKHFDQLSEAPDAVPRLRRFILDLAVRGKLVEQDPEDEPAEELLRRIEGEKAKFIKANGIKKQLSLPTVIDAESLFEIPSSWNWVQIENVAYLEMGQSPSSEFYNQHREGLPFYQGKADFGKNNPTPRYWCSVPTKLAQEGDILISVRAPVGPTNIATETCCIGRGLAALRPYQGCERDLLLLYLKQSESTLEALGAGTTFVAISRKHLATFPMPLPPLLEQHRIVAKVNELMALCDDLVAATLHGLGRDRSPNGPIDRDIGRDGSPSRPQLGHPPSPKQPGRDVSLKRPLSPKLARGGALGDSVLPNDALPHPQGGAFGEHALPIFFNQLPRLTTRPEHIRQLRQTILNLAVRGKLVPQDPREEPATDLLKRIKLERLQMAIEGRVLRETKLSPIDENTKPFSLPLGWTWTRFPELGIFERGKSKHRPRNDPSLFDGGIHLLVQTGDVARSNGLIETFTGKYNDAGLAQSNKWPKGTLCITIAANIADSGILSFDACFPDSVVGFIPAPLFPSARYFEYFIRTAKAELMEFAPATAQKNINLSILNEVLIPLPPLPEQHRIVAKVDEMMALCDELGAQIIKASATRRQLLEATLHESL